MANAMGIPPDKAQASTTASREPRRDLEPVRRLITLGSATISPINMANAYATIANGGERADVARHREGRRPRRRGRSTSYKVAAPSRPLDRGHRRRRRPTRCSRSSRAAPAPTALALGRPAAGKTGTATNADDQVSSSWFVGYTPQLATAVMYVRGNGNDQLDGWLPSYFGGDYPAETWTAVMKRDMEGVDVEEFPPPANVDGEAPDDGHQPTLPPPPTPKPTPTHDADARPAGRPRRRPPSRRRPADAQRRRRRADRRRRRRRRRDIPAPRRRAADPGLPTPTPSATATAPARGRPAPRAAPPSVARRTGCAGDGARRRGARPPDPGRPGRRRRSARASADRSARAPAGTRGGRRSGCVLALTAVVLRARHGAEGAAATTTHWGDDQQRYTHMCYSDLPYLYTGRGFAELNWPYSDDAAGAGPLRGDGVPRRHLLLRLGHRVGDPLADRLAGRRRPAPTAGRRPGRHRPRCSSEIAALRRRQRRRASRRSRCWRRGSWPASIRGDRGTRRPFAALAGAGCSPGWSTGTCSRWSCVAGALWAWARDRPVLTGVLIGLGTATKLYPLLPARRDRWSSACASGAAATCVGDRARGGRGLAASLNAPAYLTGPDAVEGLLDASTPTAAPTSARSGWCSSQAGRRSISAAHDQPLVVGALRRSGASAVAGARPRARRRRRGSRSSAFLVVAGFLLVNKVYSPQYVLWLLPLAVLARPRWRDQLIWQAGEVVLLRGGVVVPRRLPRARPAAGTPASTGSRSWSGWPPSSTSSASWCATSCCPRTTRCATAARAQVAATRLSVTYDAVERRRGEADPDVDLVADRRARAAPAGRNSIEACMCGGSAKSRCLPSTENGERTNPTASRPPRARVAARALQRRRRRSAPRGRCRGRCRR